MIRLVSFFLSFLVMTNTYAVDVVLPSLADCIMQAERFGPKAYVSELCFETAKININPIRMVSKNNGKLTVIGVENMLFITSKSDSSAIDIKIIAGSNSLLEKIIAIDVRKDSNEVAVLNYRDYKFEILFFPTNRNGNVVPTRMIRSEYLKTGTSLVYHPVTNDILVSIPGIQGITVFSSDGDSRMKIESKQPRVIKQIVGERTGLSSPFDLAVSNDKLLVLDRKSNKILIYDIDGDGDIKPLKVLDNSDFALKQPYAIDFRRSTGDIEISDGDDTVELVDMPKL